MTMVIFATMFLIGNFFSALVYLPRKVATNGEAIYSMELLISRIMLPMSMALCAVAVIKLF